MPLLPDKTEEINGLKIHEFNLLRHNDNQISLPMTPRKKTVAITVHNTEWIEVANNTTPAEQYVRATYNGNMRDCRVNYYVDNKCAWRCLPDDWVNWSCADGCSNPLSGNNTSVAIEVIGKSKEAEQNAIKLIVYLMKKYNLNTTSGLRTHSYWMNVRDGKTGTIAQLNTMKNAYKNCPIYILPHWDDFKKEVSTQLGEIQPTTQQLPKEADKKEEPKAKVEESKQKEKVKEKIDVFYRSFTKGKWWGEIKNYNNENSTGYSGVERSPINGFILKASKGEVAYRVHLLNGGWLSWITQYNPNDWIKGCAGLKTMPIDALQIEFRGIPEQDIYYRVSTTGGKDYFPWVKGTSDYAGVFGKAIDKIQIEVR